MADPKLFLMFPWVGGLNTSLDPSTIPPSDLTIASNVVFGTKGSRKKRDGVNLDYDSASNGSEFIIGGHDFWFGTSSRTQRQVTVTNGDKIYSYSSGTRSADLFTGTAWNSNCSVATLTTMNNLAVISVDGAGNVMKKWSGTGNAGDLGVYTTTGSAASSTLITNLASLSGIFPGTSISGYGINTNTTVVSINNTTAITISAAASATSTNISLTFTNNCPQATFTRQHLGRLWCNDKTNLDRVHYSTTGNPEEWLGNGDSGAIDVGIGDGDPEGITAIFPSFKGDLFVAKKTKLYRISGVVPELFSVTLVSDGIGCVSHNSVCAIDQDDIVWASERGFHSLSATQNYGDFSSTYLSAPIQSSFQDELVRARLKYIKAGYIPSINSVGFAVTETTLGVNSNNSIWLYNFPLKIWYKWPSLSCESLWVGKDADKWRFYLGTSTTRVTRTFTDSNFDLDSSGAQSAIVFRVKSGGILVDENPCSMKAFKKFSVIYRPAGAHTITASIRVDNQAAQSLSFSDVGSADLLDVDFILGSSILGNENVLAPYTLPIDGTGRVIQFEITQSGTDQEVEIQGFAIEFEDSGIAQEVITP